MRQVRALLLAIALAATACSSDSEAAVEVESPITTAAATTTEARSAPATMPAAPDTDKSDPDTDEIAFVIESEVNFGSSEGSSWHPPSPGTFVVDQGAEPLGCSSGTVVAAIGGSRSSVAFTCEDGDREGTFTFVWEYDFVAGSSWSLLDATGDFGGLKGDGLWSGTIDSETRLDSFTGGIQFGPAGLASTEADPRLVADVAAYTAAFGEGDADAAWSMVSARCKSRTSEMLFGGDLDFVFYQAPGLVATDVSAIVFGDTAAVTYVPTNGLSFADEASQQPAVFPLVAEPWVFSDGAWYWDDC